MVARIGGDEFAAFFLNLNDETGLTALARRLNGQFWEETEKLFGGTLDIPLGISMGAVTVPTNGRDYENLFPLADSALYRAKHSGKRGYVLYAQEECAELSREENLQREMERITQIVEERNDSDDALLLGFEQFASVYRFVKRSSARYEGKACKCLFVLSGDDGEALMDAAKQFGECLQKTLSRSDVILQNKTNQFFLLLPELTEQDIPAVAERIMKAWRSSPHSVGIQIENVSAPVACTTERG